MNRVTRDFVHLDRVACPWLIKRFIDREATFIFVPWGQEHRRPVDAVPFSIPGVELGPHDEQGTTLEKLLAKYCLDEPALRSIARIITAGVAHALHDEQPAADDHYGQMAVGLLAISEGMMLVNDNDPGHALARDFGVQLCAADYARIDEALRRKTSVPLAGMSVALDPYLPLGQRVADEAVTALRRLVQDGTDIDHIVLAGGGAAFFAEAVARAYPNHPLTPAPDAFYANCRGFQIAGLHHALHDARRGVPTVSAK